MKCLVKGVRQYHIFSKKLPYQNTVVFKYYCIFEFIVQYIYVYQITTSLARAGIFFQNILHLFLNILNVYYKTSIIWCLQWYICNGCNVDLVADLNILACFKYFYWWLWTYICMPRSAARLNYRSTLTVIQYINDLFLFTVNSNLSNYADDNTLFLSSKIGRKKTDFTLRFLKSYSVVLWKPYVMLRIIWYHLYN